MLGDEKTALFFIISDTDDSFNFLVSMAYTQLFNLLCERAEIDGQTARQVLGSTLKKEYRLRKYGSFHTAIELQ